MENTYETFMGRLGKNPELKYTKEGKPVCDLSVAINKGKDVPPHWRKVVVWEKQAELCSLYLKKGYEVFVQGRAQMKSFKTNEGGTKTYEEVNARLVGFTNLN
ncbi:MAG: single-stranded DNA-binding protein [Bdellovibrionota bacterium]|nr:single-stranded DNA-binding protein [Bdellovibrionota bacterium]